jgi:hypothetical protein
MRRILLMVAAVLAATTAMAGVKVRESALLFFEAFNESSGAVELKNGAKLGAESSGVSGLPADNCYEAETTSTNDGPVALVRQPYTIKGLEAITLCLWYKPSQQQVPGASLFELASIYLISQKSSSWVARVGAANVPKDQHYWFSPGMQETYRGWQQPGEWIFLALAWRKSANEVCFFQGTKSDAVKQVSRAVLNLPVGGLVQRTDKRPDVIGNTADPTHSRPFNGSLDNVRIYSRALDAVALEQIRQADQKNEQPLGF